jgi:hypothetical protein
MEGGDCETGALTELVSYFTSLRSLTAGLSSRVTSLRPEQNFGGERLNDRHEGAPFS